MLLAYLKTVKKPSLGGFLFYVRKGMKIGQVEASKGMRISQTQLSKLENNLQSLSFKVALSICGFYGIGLDELTYFFQKKGKR